MCGPLSFYAWIFFFLEKPIKRFGYVTWNVCQITDEYLEIHTLTVERMIYAATLFLSLLAVSSGKIYFQEDFNDAGWKDRWTVPTEWKPKVNFRFSPFQSWPG